MPPCTFINSKIEINLPVAVPSQSGVERLTVLELSLFTSLLWRQIQQKKKHPYTPPPPPSLSMYVLKIFITIYYPNIPKLII